MATVFGLNFYFFCLLALFIVLYFSKNMRDEGFYEGFYGMSPGTIDQLSSTHVPTMGDNINTMIQTKLIEEGVKRMTETAYGDKKEGFEAKKAEKKPEEKVYDDMFKNIDHS